MRTPHPPCPTTLADLYANTIEVGECLEWQGAFLETLPMARYSDTGRTLVRRLAYALGSPRKLPATYRVFHTCDNPRCVRFEHTTALDPRRAAARAAQTMNTATRVTALTRARRAKSTLTMEVVRQIRASTETDKVWGQRLGMHPSNISAIRRNLTWREVYGHPFAGLFTGKTIEMGNRA